MTDQDFIDHLQKENPDSVPQIDRRIVRVCYIARNQAIVLRKPEDIPIGYLLHGPIQPEEPFKLDAFCVSILYRHSGFGRELFQKLIARAQTYRALELRLSCPSDLPACQFFERMAMLHTRQTRETSGLKRLFTCYRLHIQPNPTPQIAPKSQPSRWAGYAGTHPRGH